MRFEIYCEISGMEIHEWSKNCENQILMAESKGFEPLEACTSTVFKTAAFDHSANSPWGILTNLFLFSNLNYEKFAFNSNK